MRNTRLEKQAEGKRKGRGKASVASRMRPERRGPGRAGAGWVWNRDKSRAPVLTVHRGEGICFAVHIHGEAEEREQRGRRRRVASQTQLQDLRRKGRDGGGGRVSGRPAAAGHTRAGGAAPRSPPGLLRARRGLQPQRLQLATVGARGWAVSKAAPGRRAGPRGTGGAWLASQLRPELRPGGDDGSLSAPGTRWPERL